MSETSATRRTVPEVDRRAASSAAVAARQARARVKKAIASRQLSGVTVIDRAANLPTGAEGTLRVTDFVLSLPAIGVVKMPTVLESLAISPAKRLGGLGRLQRARLRDYVENKERGMLSAPARLVVLAGPTAVGKGSVSDYIRHNFPHVHISVSVTTRHPRPGEAEGINYFFVDDAEFDRMVAADELLEHATVHNAFRYGTPRAPIERALEAGTSVLLEIDLQGARQVRTAMPQARLVFLLPPSWDELVRRLTTRGTENTAEQRTRLETAKVELAAQNEFDFRVTNVTVAEAARQVVDLIDI